MDDPRLRVGLERWVEVGAARLRLWDRPGLDGPLVQLAYPADRRLPQAGPDSPGDRAGAAGPSAERPLAPAADWLAVLAPGYRLLRLEPRQESPYQVDATDLLAVLDQFGFLTPVVFGERLGCLPALLLAAWHPGRLAGLIMVDPQANAPDDDDRSLAARALRDCPPDWSRLRQAVACPMLVIEGAADAATEPALRRFLASLALDHERR